MKSSIKLDVKDRKILYQLDLDSRKSYSQIGRRVGLNKDTVAYRVKRLQDEGIIKRFIPLINSMRMGYTWFRLYLIFQYTTSEIREEIITYFVQEKIVNIVVRTEGHFDVIVFVAVKKLSSFLYLTRTPGGFQALRGRWTSQ